MTLAVCDALERRLEALAARGLPAQVREDLAELWHDLGVAQHLLATGVPSGRAGRLLAGVQAWLPVCEAWVDPRRDCA